VISAPAVLRIAAWQTAADLEVLPATGIEVELIAAKHANFVVLMAFA